jgi:hypothetical protein
MNDYLQVKNSGQKIELLQEKRMGVLIRREKVFTEKSFAGKKY